MYDSENIPYICEECFGVLEALFIDVLLEKEDSDGISLSKELKRIDKKIMGIKKLRSKKI